jgi:enoyl-[acyl-carrier-protein] reductase (NADH)
MAAGQDSSDRARPLGRRAARRGRVRLVGDISHDRLLHRLGIALCVLFWILLITAHVSAQHFNQVEATREETVDAAMPSVYGSELGATILVPFRLRKDAIALSYHGVNTVVSNYNLLETLKAALENVLRYSAYQLDEKHIRVHAVSPGPLKTCAASEIKDFALLTEASERAPIDELVEIDVVGLTTAYLTTPFARRFTATTTYVECGLIIMA